MIVAKSAPVAARRQGKEAAWQRSREQAVPVLELAGAAFGLARFDWRMTSALLDNFPAVAAGGVFALVRGLVLFPAPVVGAFGGIVALSSALAVSYQFHLRPHIWDK